MTCPCKVVENLEKKFVYKRKYNLFNNKKLTNLKEIGPLSYILPEHEALIKDKVKFAQKVQNLKQYLKSAMKCKCIHKFIDNIPVVFVVSLVSGTEYGDFTETVNGVSLSQGNVIGEALTTGMMMLDIRTFDDDSNFEAIKHLFAHELMHLVDFCGRCPRNTDPNLSRDDYNFSKDPDMLKAFNGFQNDGGTKEITVLNFINKAKERIYKKFDIKESEYPEIQSIIDYIAQNLIGWYIDPITKNIQEFFAYLHEYHCLINIDTQQLNLYPLANLRLRMAYPGIENTLCNISVKYLLSKKQLKLADPLNSCCYSIEGNPPSECSKVSHQTNMFISELSNSIGLAIKDMFSEKTMIDADKFCCKYTKLSGDCNSEQSDDVFIGLKIKPVIDLINPKGCPKSYDVTLNLNYPENFCCNKPLSKEEEIPIFVLTVIEQECPKDKDKCVLKLSPQLSDNVDYVNSEKIMLNFIYQGCTRGVLSNQLSGDQPQGPVVDLVPKDVVLDFRNSILSEIKSLLPSGMILK